MDRPLDLGGPQRQVGGQRVRLDVGTPALEVGAQEGDPLLRAEDRSLDAQRRVGGPERVPGRCSDEEHRARPPRELLDGLDVALRQGLDRAGHEACTADQGLACTGADEDVRFGCPRDEREVGDDGGSAAALQRCDGRRGRRARLALADVHDTGAGTQGTADPVRQRAAIALDVEQDVPDRGVRGGVAEQVRHDSVRDAKAAGEVRTLGILDQDQPEVDERTGRRQRTTRRGRRGGGAGQLQRQPDARAPPGHVVVQVAVELLEPAVQIRQQGGDQQAYVERREPGVQGQRPQRAGLVEQRRLGTEVRRLHRTAQQSLDGLVVDVEATERVVRGRILATPVVDREPDPCLDVEEPRQQLGVRTRGHRDRFRALRAGGLVTSGADARPARAVSRGGQSSTPPIDTVGGTWTRGAAG